MTTFTFDATSVEPDAGRGGVIPKNWYTAIISASEIKPGASDPDAQRMNLSFKITEGDFKGAMVFHGLNVKHSNEKTMQISYAQLSSIMHAIDYLKIKADTSELHNKPLRIRVKITPAEMAEDGVTVKYEEKNEITAFKSTKDPSAVSATGAVGTASAPAAAAPPPPNGGAWQAPAAPAAAPAAAVAPAWQAPAAQPWAAPAAPNAAPAAAPSAPPAPPVAAAGAVLNVPATFVPPEGWTAHPTSPGYFYKGQEVMNEAQLQALSSTLVAAAASIPAAPAVPAAPAPAAAPAAATGQVPPPWIQQPTA